MKKIFLTLSIILSSSANAGYEFICKEGNLRENTYKVKTHIKINCKNSDEVKKSLLKANFDVQNYFAKESRLPVEQKKYKLHPNQRLTCSKALTSFETNVGNNPALNFDGMLAENYISQCNTVLWEID
jgi:hypothetical protein